MTTQRQPTTSLNARSPSLLLPMIPQSGCPSQSNTSIREMKAGGAGIHASLTLPNSLGSRVSGVPVATAVAVDTSGSRDTTIIGVSTATPSGSYGAGQVS